MVKYYGKKPSSGTSVFPNTETITKYPNPYSPVNPNGGTPASNIESQIRNDISKINNNKKPRKA